MDIFKVHFLIAYLPHGTGFAFFLISRVLIMLFFLADEFLPSYLSAALNDTNLHAQKTFQAENTDLKEQSVLANLQQRHNAPSSTVPVPQILTPLPPGSSSASESKPDEAAKPNGSASISQSI
jgi:hypothetical protein